MEGKKQIRVRFAPSPTGSLHVGGARTALFNYLFAHHTGGEFLLRIEDTDLERSKGALSEQILRSLKWLSIDWDGEVVYQAARVERHREVCAQLVSSGHAYPCFCSRESLAEKKEAALQESGEYRYDRKCRDIPSSVAEKRIEEGEPYALRLKIPEGQTTVHDVVKGEVTVSHSEIDDFIILRTNGMPVYQMAVVVDDHDMDISHVIRGDDHLSNTPKQVMIYRAMEWDLPVFVHVPLILGPDKKRLSKRHGATSVEEYRDDGILPEALVNFLALLGWSPGEDREILDRNELERLFTLERINTTPSVFDETKLEWMNAQYISRISNGELLKSVGPSLIDKGLTDEAHMVDDRNYLIRCLELMRPRMKRLTDFAESCDYFFKDPDRFEEKAVQKHWQKTGTRTRTNQLLQVVGKVEEWSIESLETQIRELATRLAVGLGKLLQPARLAMTGTTASPGMFELMQVLGKETVMRRLQKALPLMEE